jgi:hypothetical protein
MAIVPKIPAVLKPARRVVPLSIPKLMKHGLAKRMLTQAVPDLNMLFPANSEAAYFGYEKGMYVNRYLVTA